VRFGPVFLNSDLPMGRWRELTQGEVDTLSAEVGLAAVAMPSMTTKTKDKLERMQRKSSRPMGRGERVRTLRPAHDGAPSTEQRPARQPRGDSAPASRKDSGRGTPVAERPADMNKRPAKPAGKPGAKPAAKRPGIKLVDDAPSGNRRGPAAGTGQRPGFGRRKPKPE
jgi:23S rRNA pseudouridine2605 synthase